MAPPAAAGDDAVVAADEPAAPLEVVLAGEHALVPQEHIALDGDDLLLAAEGDGGVRLVRFSLAEARVTQHAAALAPPGAWRARLDGDKGLARVGWRDGCLHTWELGFDGRAREATGRCAPGWLEDVDAGGRWAALSSDAGRLALVDLADGTTRDLGAVRLAAARTARVRFDESAELLVASTGQVWSRTLGREIGSFPAPTAWGHGPAEAALVSRSRDQIAVSDGRRLVIRSLASGDATAYATWKGEQLRAWAFSAALGLLVASDGGGLWRVDAQGSRFFGRPVGGQGAAIDAIAAAGARAATVDERGLVELWDVARLRRLGAIAFFADGHYLAFGDDGAFCGTSAARDRVTTTPAAAHGALVRDPQRVAAALLGGTP